MSDEAHFHLSVFVNKQNFNFWAGRNPRLLHERAKLHGQKVTFWCAISASGIIAPFFIENEAGYTVACHSKRYVEMIQHFLQGSLNYSWGHLVDIVFKK